MWTVAQMWRGVAQMWRGVARLVDQADHQICFEVVRILFLASDRNQ
jgi:hypothetical protein